LVQSPSFAINVENIDEAIKKIKNAGGLILKDKMQVGEMGFLAYFKDPEGNILSVWQSLIKK
jgi:predicted enzyme related to lactoylglutathione lyase